MKGEKQILNQIINLIYPPKCGLCGKLSQKFLCERCEKKLKSQVKFEMKKYKNNYYEEHLYIFKYQGMIRKILIDYKFNDKSYLYKTIVNFLLKNEKIFKILKSYDTIIPVPISKKRNKERGYNQSSLIAKELAKNIGTIEYNDKCLIKTKNIVQQSKLKRIERMKNIQNAYELKQKDRLFNKKILLVDDIYTTGSTVNECCKILDKANVNKIGIFTIAKD